jgi:hypothetical protein
MSDPAVGPQCEVCGHGLNTYAHFTQCVGGAGRAKLRPSGPPVGHGPAFRPFIAAFLARHLIGDEPADAPPSRLDVLDGATHS